RELAVRGAVSVAELSELLGASPATIRRDLVALEREGVAQRSYGGAAMRAVRPAEEALAVRAHKHVHEKHAVARAALAVVKPGDTLFLNDGSTILALARELAASDIELFIVTSAVNVAHLLVANPKLTVCLLGGFVRPTSLASGGPFAEAMIEQFNADLALLSCDAFSPAEGMSFMHAEDAAVARRMAARAKRCVGLVISPKFSWSARVTGVPLTEIDALVTDAIAPDLAAVLARAEIDILDGRRAQPRRGGDGRH
ncbi:MAG: DeoR/GlpR transcriptional regulator, partial [Alphaproteobacteria bacterium]|nr:DeoR/GlpR transcriptional regulator [Alphaproteobacteria bacterium]